MTDFRAAILRPLLHGRFRDLLGLVFPDHASTSIRIGLAIGSFIIYAAAVMVLREHRYSQYGAEQFELAAAVSNLVYGAPIGTIYSGLLQPFVYKPGPVQQTLEETARGGSETGPLLMAVPDGNGIGYTIVATLAMRLFGLHLSSLTLALITIMGLSTFLFLLRYQDDRVFVVVLYFFALTIMLFTPLVTNERFANGAPVGGIRYFSLLGIMPAMHIFWEIVGSAKSDSEASPGKFILLGVQVLVLAVVILVRGSALYLLGALMVAYFATLGECRGDPAVVRNLLRKGALVAVLSSVVVASFYLSVPQAYKESGRTTGLVWHRVLVSLGANPAWPFGNLRDVYSSCQRYTPPQYTTPQSLLPGVFDWNGHCIWAVYGLEHGLTPREMIDELYGGRYETLMKEAFFAIAREYPMEVFETFFYYKPLRILTSLRRLSGLGAPGKTLGIKLLLLTLPLAQTSALVAFVVFGTSGAPENHTRLLIRALLLFSIFAIVPYLVAWSNPPSSAELVFYIISGLAAALTAVFEAFRRRFRD